MKQLVLITSFALVASTGRGPSQTETPQSLSDLESVLAHEIEQGAPTESTGMESSILGTISLEAYLGTLRDRDLRAREVVLSPGARIAVHVHNQRPAIAYVLEGELVEHRNDSEQPIVRRRGDSYFEGPDVVHWVENVSPKPVRVLSVDIVPNDAE